MTNALKNFMGMGGSVTRQVGNYIFGLDNTNLVSDESEILVFSANSGALVKSKMITPVEQMDIKSVDDIYDFVFGAPTTAPDFTSTLTVK